MLNGKTHYFNGHFLICFLYVSQRVPLGRSGIPSWYLGLWLLSLLATFVAVEGGDTCQQGFLYKAPRLLQRLNCEMCELW